MSKFKGTPGPWYVTGHMTKYIEARIGGGIFQEVAAVGPTDAVGGYGSQQRANARLIAAAPELLESLDELANGYAGNGWDVGIVPRISKARAAIAKALGEDSP